MIAILISLYLTYAGVTSFALATDKHHLQAFARKPGAARTRALRWTGAGLLLAALSLWLWGVGVTMGLVSWLLWVLPLVAIGVVAGFAFRPALTARLALRQLRD
ncbi:DUF3325 family protein [Altererythrobacter xixiisoli]|uniref:DUF3325 family protein n=1 Tax=Croceibacterium xixiisoli TaxID=1476466 RepID=A0A6I4TX68_9SPHN|nr:DUF3325 domain-containing protein [Croceibacterium xixiisoli]MXP00595.1 DUF3325 family protein [Croceibacterium xixiisoli]